MKNSFIYGTFAYFKDGKYFDSKESILINPRHLIFFRKINESAKYPGVLQAEITDHNTAYAVKLYSKELSTILDSFEQEGNIRNQGKEE